MVTDVVYSAVCLFHAVLVSHDLQLMSPYWSVSSVW